MTPQKPLRDALKDFLEQDSLTDQDIQQLQGLSKDQHFQTKSKTARSTKLTTLLSLAAIFFVVVAVGFTYKMHTNDLVQQRLAHEVFTNHLKIRSLDIETHSLQELRGFFERLDFSPFFSGDVRTADLKLLGGRYCTLQGAVALQLRLLSPDGEVITYYQALYEKERFGKLPNISVGDKPNVILEKGIEMSIWQENSVVSVLAQATPYH